MIADPAQEANANTARDASGEDSPVDRVARARNVGRDLAKKIVVANLIDTAETKKKAAEALGVTVTPEPMPPQPTGGDDDRQQQPAGTAG